MAEALVTQVQQDEGNTQSSGIASLVTQVQPDAAKIEAKLPTSPSKGGLLSCLFCCCAADEATAQAKPASANAAASAPIKKGVDQPKPQQAQKIETGKAQAHAPTEENDEDPQPQTDEEPDVQWLLGPLIPQDQGRKTLVLDLDETLVHSSFKPIPDADFTIDIELEGMIHKVYVRKRPGVDEFMLDVGKKWEVVIFTASLAKYADPLLDVLDIHKVVRARLFRESCVQHYGNYVKDLSLLGRRLEDSVIVDNSPFSYMFQPDNAIPIVSWFNDRSDTQLYELMPFLDSLLTIDDVTTVLQKQPN